MNNNKGFSTCVGLGVVFLIGAVILPMLLDWPFYPFAILAVLAFAASGYFIYRSGVEKQNGSDANARP